MQNFTKKAIKETFVTLLDQRPLNRITVKDIVETCGINRNSFTTTLRICPPWWTRSSPIRWRNWSPATPP